MFLIITLNNRLAVFLEVLTYYDSAVSLLYIYPGETRAYFLQKTYTGMFMAALFIIALNWKQSKRPSTEEWVNKLCYIHSME